MAKKSSQATLTKILKSVESIVRDLKSLISEGAAGAGVGDETQSEDGGQEAFVSPPPRARIPKPSAVVKAAAAAVPVPPLPPKPRGRPPKHAVVVPRGRPPKHAVVVVKVAPAPKAAPVVRVAPAAKVTTVAKSPAKVVSVHERQEFKDEYIKKGGKMGRGRPPSWWVSSEEKIDADRQLHG